MFIRPLYLGEVISFRYVKKTANDRAPLVMVLTQNYENYLHGLNLRYMSPIHAKQLYWFFQLPQEQREEISPMRFHSEQEFQQRVNQEYEQRKQQQMQQQTGVIVKPAQGNVFGVSTWGPTQKQVQMAFPGMPGVEEKTYEQPRYRQELTPQEMEERERLMYIEQQSRMRDYVGNPYVFYHKYIKAMFGHSKNIAQVYRKYDPRFIRNVRIVRGLERLYKGM